MASPKIVAATLNTGNYTVGALTNVTITSVGIPANDNAMLACMAIIGTISDPGIITPPAGWELVQQDITGAGSTTRVAVFSKIASSESGSYVFSWTNISATGFWIFSEYGGGDSLDAVDGPGYSQRNVTGLNSIAPESFPSTWNNYNTLVCVWAAQLSIGNIMFMGAPEEMTLRAQSSSLLISFPALMLADLPLTDNASTGTRTAVAAFATPSLGVSLLIKQSPFAGMVPSGGSGGM